MFTTDCDIKKSVSCNYTPGAPCGDEELTGLNDHCGGKLETTAPGAGTDGHTTVIKSFPPFKYPTAERPYLKPCFL